MNPILSELSNHEPVDSVQVDSMRLTNLLMVEDNSDDASLTRRIIQHYDNQIAVVVHSTAETALYYLKQAAPAPQLILLDLGLPGMSGIDFIQALRDMRGYKHIPIVILTGHPRDVAQAFPLGVDGYLLKPLEADSFQAVLKSNKLI